MAKKITTIKERVLYIAEVKGINREVFFSAIGMSYANFKGIAKNTALNSDAIVNILSKFPDVNVDWLLTGKGEMLKKTYCIEEPIVADPEVLYKPKSKAIDNNNNILLLDYKERLAEKEKEIASLNQEIGVLKEKLSSRNVPDVPNISTPIPTKQNSDTAIVLPISDKTANLPKPKR